MNIPTLLLAGILAVPQLALAEDSNEACVRSEPSPVFAGASRAIQSHAFHATSSHEGRERFRLPSGTRVTIVHGGCEYIVATFTFESGSLFAKGYSPRKAFSAAAGLLHDLHALGAKPGFDLNLAAATLRAAARQRAEPRLAEELVIEGDGGPPLDAHLQVDAAGRKGTTGFVRLTLFRGPL